MKKDIKVTKEPVKKERNFNGLIGVLQLFAVASIIYSTVKLGLIADSTLDLILIAPQGILALIITISKFSK